MPRKKTQDEYKQQVRDKAPHIQVIGEYKGNRVPIEHYCIKHNIQWDVSPFNFLQHPNGCRECQNEIMQKYYDSKRKSDERFKQEVESLGAGIVPMGKYKGTHERMHFRCKEGHIWPSTPHDILDGYGCPYCAGNAILKGYNDLWTTNPEIAQMLKDSNMGYEISRGSHREVDWICPNCGALKTSSPKQIYSYGLACSKCSDGISYPNRFIIALLSQLDVEFFQPEWSPEWIGRYRYDAYFIHNEQEYIVEMDGGIGHGELDFITRGRDTEGIKRDITKDNQAALHDITLIRVDCKYEKKDIHYRFEYIKNSILNSNLSNIFDLSNIDWERCNKDATKSLHMVAAKQYDNGKSIRQISEELHINYNTVYNWLKRMGNEGLCSYKAIRGAMSHHKNRNKLVNIGT